MTSGTHTINGSHQSSVDVTPRVRTITPSGSRTRVSGAGGRRSNKECQRLQPLASVGLPTTFTGIHICYIDIPQWVLTRHLRTFFFVIFFVQSAFSTPRCRPSKVLLEFKALILKTEHKQTLQSVAVLDCIERILIGREDISHLGWKQVRRL